MQPATFFPFGFWRARGFFVVQTGSSNVAQRVKGELMPQVAAAVAGGAGGGGAALHSYDPCASSVRHHHLRAVPH